MIRKRIGAPCESGASVRCWHGGGKPTAAAWVSTGGWSNGRWRGCISFVGYECAGSGEPKSMRRVPRHRTLYTHLCGTTSRRTLLLGTLKGPAVFRMPYRISASVSTLLKNRLSAYLHIRPCFHPTIGPLLAGNCGHPRWCSSEPSIHNVGPRRTGTQTEPLSSPELDAVQRGYDDPPRLVQTGRLLLPTGRKGFDDASKFIYCDDWYHDVLTVQSITRCARWPGICSKAMDHQNR